MSLVDDVRGMGDEIAVRTARLGRPVRVDPLALLTERAASAGLRVGGQVSWGGASRLLASIDGWVAVTLARPTDWELVPALLELPSPVADGEWATVAAGVSRLEAHELRRRSELLGLPLAVPGERRGRREAGVPGDDTAAGVRSRRIRTAPAGVATAELVVADLSALWAGPLVGRLLRAAGARVMKIESVGRPDGGRSGDPAFFARMNGGKSSVTLAIDRTDGRRRLGEIVSGADVVITSSRPRALEQLGLDAEAIVRHRRPRVWLMISGYGQTGEWQNRAAFGDDAAVAGGLIGWHGTTPCFFGDAVADPFTGLAATVAVLSALESDGAWTIDASMADVAAGTSIPTPTPH